MSHQPETEKLAAPSEQLELSPNVVLDDKAQKIEKQRVDLLNAVAAS